MKIRIATLRNAKRNRVQRQPPGPLKTLRLKRCSGPLGRSRYERPQHCNFVTQGVGSSTWTMIANAGRLLVSAAGALIAIYWLDLGQDGFFVAIAGGFCAYAALATAAA